MLPGENARLQKVSLSIVAGEGWLVGTIATAGALHVQSPAPREDGAGFCFLLRVVFHLVELFVSGAETGSKFPSAC